MSWYCSNLILGDLAMNKLLAQAFEKASQLPDNLQDELARTLLDELTEEGRWEQALRESPGKLDQMAGDALKQHQSGATKEMGFDKL